MIRAGGCEIIEFLEEPGHSGIVLRKELQQAEDTLAGFVTEKVLYFAGIDFSTGVADTQNLVEKVRDHLPVVNHLHGNLLAILGETEMMTVNL